MIIVFHRNTLNWVKILLLSFINLIFGKCLHHIMGLLYNCGHQVQNNKAVNVALATQGGKGWLHSCRGSSVERTKQSSYLEASVVQIVNIGNKPAMFDLETFWKLIFQLSAKVVSPQKTACKNRPNPRRIPPTFSPLISASVSPSYSLQWCKLSFKHTYMTGTCRGTLEFGKILFMLSLLSFTKALVNVAHLFGLCAWLQRQK